MLGRARWDADALRDMVRDYALEALAGPDAVLVIDETACPRGFHGHASSKASCGVGRQYTGSAGKITHCQIGVFAAYVSSKGHALVDRQLYLPKDWTGNRERLAKADVPDNLGFPTKPSLAVAMVCRAIEAELPFAWVAAETVYGVAEVEMARRRAGTGYVLGVPAPQPFKPWDKPREVAGTAEEIANTLPEGDWVRVSAGEGTKGPRLFDWAYLDLSGLLSGLG